MAHNWLWLFLLAVCALGAWSFYRAIFRPLGDLGRMIRALARGQRPSTFVIRGASYFSRLASDIESVADEQSRLKKQTAEEHFNLKAILSSMVEGVMVVDTNHVILQVNDSFGKLFELTESPLGKTVLRTLRDASIEEIVRSALRSGQLQTREISPIHQSPQTAYHFAVSAMPLKSPEGETGGVVVVCHDISRLRQLEDIRREFVANVSHELRTPLSIFSGYLENLIDNPAIPRKELLSSLEIMEKHSRRLNALLEDLLALARLEARSEKLEPVPIHPEKFLREIVNDWKRKLEQKKIALTLDLPADLLPFTADTVLMERVLNNLMDNAVKYTGEGGRMTISARSSGPVTTITVRDTGLGIPAHDLPHVFERFYRVEKARSREAGGTGLGLSIVKHIVGLHGGAVSAESAYGEGTAITISLPGELPRPEEIQTPEGGG